MRQDAGADGANRADPEDNGWRPRTILRPDRIEPDIERVRKYLLPCKFLTAILTEEKYRAAIAGKG